MLHVKKERFIIYRVDLAKFERRLLKNIRQVRSLQRKYTGSSYKQYAMQLVELINFLVFFLLQIVVNLLLFYAVVVGRSPFQKVAN